MKTSQFLLAVCVALLLLPGCKPDRVYVNMLNLSGPWDGSEAHPYKTIQDGIKNAKTGDRVLVMDNAYFENVTLKAGVDLESWKGTPKLAGTLSGPTILAKGDNAIVGLMIRGGTAAISVQPGALLKTEDKTFILIKDCEIFETHRAIEVVTPTDLAFASKQRKSLKVTADHNWIRNITGDGIRIDLTGPKTGELKVSLRVEENVIQGPFIAGINLVANGQGANPGGIVRTRYVGTVGNNLIFGGKYGIRFHGSNLGDVGVEVSNNTIANNIAHGITASADSGPDGAGSAHPDVINNIIAGNQGYGYQELTSFSSAIQMSNNLFHQNAKGHYADNETNKVINSQAGLNQPVVNNKVVFIGGSGNLVKNPQLVAGTFPWMGTMNTKGPHAFFLEQSGSTMSPAVNGGKGTAKDAKLSARTTKTDFTFDSGVVDIGFHYKKL